MRQVRSLFTVTYQRDKNSRVTLAIEYPRRVEKVVDAIDPSHRAGVNTHELALPSSSSPLGLSFGGCFGRTEEPCIAGIRDDAYLPSINAPGFDHARHVGRERHDRIGSRIHA